MAIPPIDNLRENIQRVQARRKKIFTMRALCLGLAVIVALFMALGLTEMAFQFPITGRIALFSLLLAGVGALGLWFLHAGRQIRVDDRRIAHYIEGHIPELEQRLVTSMESGGIEKKGWSPQLMERLWEDTGARIEGRSLLQVTPVRVVWSAAGAAILMICLLVFTLWNWTDFSRAGKRVILPWSGTIEKITLPVKLTVAPGDARIQRGNDVMLIARIENAVPKKVDLFLQTDQVNWTRVPMVREGAENTYLHFLSSVKKDVRYYVDIGMKRSSQHRIAVFDIPRVERIAVDYVYPKYTGMENKTVENQGDVIAPEGTRIRLRAAFNKTVEKATLHFDDGMAVELETDRKTATGSFVLSKDATYTIHVIDSEHMENEDPYEYFVRSIPDGPPVLTNIRPGRDRRVMSLEEVSIAAAAQDDYGLEKFVVHYKAAGGGNQEVPFLREAKQALNITVEGKTTIYLEDLALEPGDFITYYITAVDNNGIAGYSEIISDIYFLEVVPTEEEFRRAPQLGGRGGAGGRGRPSSALVENQKNIIAATWKLLKRQKAMIPEKFEENIKILVESQGEVMQRAQLSLRRLLERFSFSDESYDRAVDHLKRAVTHMEAAIELLTSRKLEEALGPEQSALRAIMKAESESRKTMIQMARNQGGGRGGGQQLRERQDLKELFEMELGRLENRYELPRQGGGFQQETEKEDTLAKLRDLARRQERLNRGQQDLTRRQERMTDAQKQRRLEELRREQEELRRQAEGLSRRMSRLANQNGFRQWSDRQRQLEQAARQMREASRSLQRREPDTAAAQSLKALENLRDQEQEMSLQRQATVSHMLDELKKRARNLQIQEKQILKKLEGLKRQKDNAISQDEPEALSSRGIKDVLASKNKMTRELAEAEAMLRAIGKEGQPDQPEIAGKAIDTLRNLKAEELEERIEESRRMLKEGWLSLTMDVEKKIDQSIDRVSQRLQNLDQRRLQSKEEQVRQAAAEARGLRRELENLQQQVEALQESNRQMQGGGAPSKQQGGRQQGAVGGRPGGNLERMRESLQRSRRYARGLVQPWARGERWAVDARSIQRELAQKEIEDFLSQPDLWKRLLEPVKELETTLRAQAEVSQLRKRVFSAQEEEAPTPYKHQVEEYYRDLSRGQRSVGPQEQGKGAKESGGSE